MARFRVAEAKARSKANSTRGKLKKEINKNRALKANAERFKAVTAEIREQHKRIKEGHKKIVEKFEKIESKCSQLKKKTKAISEQNAYNQMRLILIFGILKARQDNNSAHAESLTLSLCELEQRSRTSKRKLWLISDSSNTE